MINGHRALPSKLVKTCLLIVILMATGRTVNAYQIASLNRTSVNRALNISVHFNNEPLDNALHILADKANVGISYNAKMVPDKKITYSAIKASVYTILGDILKDTGLYATLSQNRKVILIKERRLQQVVKRETITGTVTDVKTGDPLIGVNILVIGSSNGAATDVNGHYEVAVPSPQDTLRFTYIGYKTKMVPLNGRTKVDVQMSPSVISLGDQLVVVAYGTTEREDFTGSIATVSPEAFESVPRVSALQSLQGNVAGVRVTRSNGQPGAPVSVYIRGKGSVNASSSPLYVVDGVPVETGGGIEYGSYGGYSTSGIAGINPADIASMTVLKDAAATSIYGSRGSNGVILITTKKGNSGEIGVHFSTQYGFNTMMWAEKNRPLNTAEMLELLKEGWVNDGRDPNDFAQELIDNEIDPNHSTNWQDALTRTGSMKKYYLSLSGGSDKTTYFVSGGFYDTESSLKFLNYKRGTARVSVTTKPIKSLRVNVGLSANVQKTLNAQRTSGWLASPVRAIYRMQPWIPIYNSDGSYNFGFNTTYNPVAVVSETNHKGLSRKIKALIGLNLNITKELEFESKADLSYTSGVTNMFFPGDFGWGRNTEGRGYVRNNLYTVWTTSNILRYNHTFNSRHSFESYVGMAAQKYSHSGSYASATGFPPGLKTLGSASTPSVIDAYTTENTIVGVFLNANYSYNDMLNLSASVRRDGSSRFGTENRYGNFWSVGAGWIFNETLLPDVNFISLLKLRGSYGTSGNQELGNYESTGRYGTAVYGGATGFYFSQYANSLLTWEKAKQFDIGIEFGLLRNRITGVIDYYQRTTSGLLYDRPLPATSGRTSITQNFGSMQNSGIEFNLTSRNIVSLRDNGFNWTTNFNISTLKNKVIKIPNTEITSYYMRKEGLNYYTWYLPAYAGVDPQTGEKLWYSSKDKSQTTTDYDDAVRLKFGNSMPKFYGGLTNTLNYKNLTFSFMLYFNWGNKIYDLRGTATNSDGSEGFNTSGKLSRYTYENRWQKSGDITDVPKIVFDGPDSHRSSRWLASGDYIRLRDISLGYNIPSKWLNKINIKNMKIYIQASNVYTYVRDDRVRYDPEQSIAGQEAQRTPKNRTLVLGLDLDF